MGYNLTRILNNSFLIWDGLIDSNSGSGSGRLNLTKCLVVVVNSIIDDDDIITLRNGRGSGRGSGRGLTPEAYRNYSFGGPTGPDIGRIGVSAAWSADTSGLEISPTQLSSDVFRLIEFLSNAVEETLIKRI